MSTTCKRFVEWYKTYHKEFWIASFVAAYTIVMVGSLVIGIIKIHEHNTYSKHNYHVYQDKNILHMQSVKYQLVEEVDNYMSSVAPETCLNAIAVVDACDEYDIDLIFVLAQGQIESHYGTKGIASKTNSVFNVFSYDGVSAEEINRSGKGYKHPDFSVEPYLKLLRDRYLVDGKTERDMFHEFVDMNGHRYASAENYEKQLMSTYLKIDSVTNISHLLREYKKYKIITYQ